MELKSGRSTQGLEEPGWPGEPGPYLFVVEVTGPFERRLLDAWLERQRPPHVDPGQVQMVELPTTRRTPSRRRPDPALRAFLAADEDALIVPLRVVWLLPEREGRRTVGLRDLLVFGDPRDPGPMRQYLIHRRHPDRVRIISGQPDRLENLRTSWATPEAMRQGRSFVDEVARRAWLTLEHAERALRGNRYKVPKFPRETLLNDGDFQAGVARLARSSGVSYPRMATRTGRYVRQIAATHSPYVIDLVTGGFRWLIGKAYVDLEYDRDELAALYQMAERSPLVFLPTHKSHFDHQSLQFALYENGLPPNHTAGGIDMSFFPVGPLLRRSGVFFIRREFKDNEPYKFVLRRYVDYLLQHRFPLEWYIEGTRSRTGKLQPPRYGMLAYVVESYLRGSSDDVIFIPVAIAYDQIQDVRSYAAEQSGSPKRPATFAWLVRAVRGLKVSYGSIHLRLGAPISLRGFLTEIGDTPTDADDIRSPVIPKLAFDIANRINEVTPITPISLVTLVLLGAEDHRLSVPEIEEALAPYVSQAQQRRLPTTTEKPLDDPALLREALDELALHDIVRQVNGAVYEIAPDSLLAAAYYRNTVIHFFVDGAIAELATMGVTGDEVDPVEAMLNEARKIRELLLFEFFFSGRHLFADEIRSELEERLPGWQDRFESGDVRDVKTAFRPYQSPAVLRPFLEAYRVVADLIEDHDSLGPIDEGSLVGRAMTRGKQYLAEGVITSGESVSKHVFETAVKLARHRGLFEPTSDLGDRRKAFAGEIRELADRVSAASKGGGYSGR